MPTSPTTKLKPQVTTTSRKQAKTGMPWSDQETAAQAENWKREKLAQIEAHIKIAKTLLRMRYEDLQQLNGMTGENLSAYYATLTPAEIENDMRSKREFEEELQDIWIEAELRGTLKKSA